VGQLGRRDVEHRAQHRIRKRPINSIMLHVRGGGDDVLAVIVQIAAAVGARALDISTGEFLTGDPTQTAGWHDFQQYRD
jgi:hypothetical protein